MIKYTGLRKRPTFEGIVDYLANRQEKVKYPNREAKIIRNHPYLTQLDGLGMFEMQEQQENEWKEKEKEHRVKEMTSQGTQSAPEVRTELRREQGATSSTQYFDLGKQDAEMTEEMDTTSEENRKRGRSMSENQSKRMARTVEVASSYLEYVPEYSQFTHFAAAKAVERMKRSRSPFTRNDVKPEPVIKQEPEMEDFPFKTERSQSRGVKQEPVVKMETDVKEERSRSRGVKQEPVQKNNVKPEPPVKFQRSRSPPVKSEGTKQTSKQEPQDIAPVISKRVLGQGSATKQAPKVNQQVPPPLPPPPSPPPQLRSRGQKRNGGTPPVRGKSDDVQVTGVAINRTRDMKFWEEQSARELRSQLTLRDPKGIGNWAFKTRAQLLEIFRARTAGADW